MKTLNEVIKAHEICVFNLDCMDCPYCNEPADSKKWGCALCGECPKDALYYLKENRKLKSLLADMVREKIHGENEEENLPLTWDEFTQMEGKPVWIEGPFITEGPHWIIVGPSHLYNGKIVGYGKTWQAYRRENENTR